MGVVYRVFFPKPEGAAQAIDARFLFDVQAPWREPTDPDARLGFELGYQDVVRLRSGYAFLQSESRGPSIGLGLTLGRLGIDFARAFFESANFDEPVYLSLRILL